MAGTRERAGGNDGGGKTWTVTRVLSGFSREDYRPPEPLPAEVIRLWGEVRDCSVGELRYFFSLSYRDPQEALSASLPRSETMPIVGHYILLEGRLQLRWRDQRGLAELYFVGDRLVHDRGLSFRLQDHQGSVDEIVQTHNAPRPMPPSIASVALVVPENSHGEKDFMAGIKKSPVHVERFFARMSDINEICRRIEEAAESGCDLVVIARGGGAKVDLEPFNSVEVVETVARVSQVMPTLVAVGHADDHPVVERVASRYLATPSKAAGECARLAQANARRALVRAAPSGVATAPAMPSILAPARSTPSALAAVRWTERPFWRRTLLVLALAAGVLGGWWVRGLAQPSPSAASPAAPSPPPKPPPKPPMTGTSGPSRHRGH